MISLLILSCGTNANWHIVNVLRAKFGGSFRLVGTDINDARTLAIVKKLDAFYQVPMSSHPSFVTELKKILHVERPNFILPSFDSDQLLFYNGSDILSDTFTESLSTPRETLEVYADKLSMCCALSNAGLPIPRLIKRDKYDLNDICIVKPIHGVGSVGIRKCRVGDLSVEDWSNKFIRQELCHRPEVTMECFVLNGRFSSVCRERLQTKAGVCTKARVFSSPKLAAIGREFAKKFKTPMMFNLQFMVNSVGMPVITDVNLRFAGGMGLSYAAGWDVVSAMAKVMRKRPVNEVFETLPELIPEQYVVRTYSDEVTTCENKCVAFDLDGTLLDSRKRHKVVLDDILRERGIAIDTSSLIEYKRNGHNNIEFLVSRGVAIDLATLIQAEWIQRIEFSKYLELDVLYDDTLDVLNQYNQWRRILITARNNEEGVRLQLAKLDLANEFDSIFVVKPGCSAFKEKSRILNTEHVLKFYGDTNSDCKAAELADVAFEYRGCGFHSRQIVFGEV